MNEMLPVEPLSPAARQRITEGVIDQLAQERYTLSAAPSRSRRWWWLGGGAAVAVAAAVVLLVVSKSPSASHTAARKGADETRIAAGDAPSTVTVGTSTLTLAAHTSVVVTGDDDRGILVRLETGRVLCKVAPRRGRPPFRVQAGGVRVQVIGTKFAVARYGDKVRVKVVSGIVQVTAEGEDTLLHAGEGWRSDATAGVGAETETETETNTKPGKADVMRQRVSSKRSVRKRRHRRHRSRPRHRVRASKHKKPAQSAAVLYRRAASLERSDPAAALALYRKVESMGGKWAAAALFARASLNLAQGNKGAARRLARRYLQLYPRGVNAAMARQLATSQ